MPKKTPAAGWVVLAAFAVAVLGSSPVATAAELSARTLVSKPEVFVGEVFSCYVAVDGTDQAERPAFPSTEELDVRFAGGHPSMEKGVKRITFTFECLPRVPGEVRIPRMTVKAGTEALFTEAAAVMVKAPDETDAMKVRMSLSKNQAYEGEAVLLTFEWHSELFLNGIRAVDLRFPAMNDSRFRLYEPRKTIDPNDAHAIGLPVQNRRIIAQLTEGRKDDTPLNDIRFDLILVPRETGKLTIPPVTLLCSYVPPKDQKFSGFRYPSYFNNDFFDQDVVVDHQRFLVRSEPVTINVVPLPVEGRPADFDGIIGKIDIATEAQPSVVAVSDPINLRVQISGHPFAQILPLPDLSRQDALTYSFDIPPESVTSEMRGKDRWITQIVRPLRENVKLVPPVRLSYFDPEQGKYDFAVSEAIPLTVTRASTVNAFDAVFSDGSRLRNEVRRSVAGISANDRDEGSLLVRRQREGWLDANPRFWIALLGGPALAFWILTAASRRYRFALWDPAAARARDAYKVFQRRLNSVKGRAERDPDQAVVLLHDAVDRYLADRFGLTPGASSYQEFVRLLESRQVDEGVIQRLQSFWDHAASSRFSKKGGNGSNLSQLAREVPSAVSDLERGLPS